MDSEQTYNTLKVCGDSEPLILKQNECDMFSLEETKISSSWFPPNTRGEMKLSDLRKGIEPWLTSLFQSEHLSLLVGTGLTNSVQCIASGKLNNTMSEPQLETDYADRITYRANCVAKKSSRGKANVEDYIRAINELLQGLEVLGHDSGNSDEKEKYEKLDDNLDKIIKDFTTGIAKAEYDIAGASETKRNEAFEYLVSFLMSFASRIGTRERLNIFTTNYDRLIEAGADLAGLHLLDRFTGTLEPIFRSSRLDIDMHYNPPGIRGEPRYLEGVARFTKLHGSIDWVNTKEDIRRIGLPFGSKNIDSFFKESGFENTDSRQIMIYPNAAKDRETTEYPYVELFRDFAAALCRPNSTLVTYGYGFGDDHINRVIRDMLTIPSTHLVIISYDDAGGRIMEKYKEFGRASQISLIIGNGLSDLQILVDNFMPKPSIDRASMRMSELLKQRYSIPSDDGGETTK